jgi:hypothetical protein
VSDAPIGDRFPAFADRSRRDGALSARDRQCEPLEHRLGKGKGVSKAIAKPNQYEGRVDPNSCSATQTFAVGGPSRISVLTAGTNAGGFLYTQVIGRGGDVGAETYDANAAGTYGFRVCLRSDDGIDNATISYVSMVVISPC